MMILHSIGKEMRWMAKKSSYYSACVVEIYEELILLLQPVMSIQSLSVRFLREKAAILYVI